MSSNIRNLCLLGHGGNGKTSLTESMLFLTKAADRLGKVSDGNTVSDFDPEEIRRQISIAATCLPVEYNGKKLNVFDAPGYFDFTGEVLQSLSVADTGVIIVTAKSGIDVGTEKAWRLLTKHNKSKFIYISKLDEENADFQRSFAGLREQFGTSVCALAIPVIEGGKCVGIVDVACQKAWKPDNGKKTEMPIPADLTDLLEEYTLVLRETVAETSEALMEKFFADEPFTQEEMIAGIREGVKTGTLTPVFCGSAFTGVGTLSLLDALIDYAPAPEDAAPPKTTDGQDILCDPAGQTVAFIFRTTSDQYGKFSFFKVLRGSVSADMSLVNARTENHEKIGHIYTIRGKKNTEVKTIACGDIGAVSKLIDTKTGDTLCADKAVVAMPAIDFPKPCYARAFYPKTKGGEEKIVTGLSRMSEEDQTFTYVNDAEVRQLIVTGQGDIHLDVLSARLKSKFGADVEMGEPRVPYREKIRKKVSVEGKHKKQSGGHGQYGHVKIEFEPGESEGLEFSERIFGGSVPKNFHPAVEKGLQDCIHKGVLAGFPVVNLKATLYDGSYHDVDSSEMAFKLAARLAYKAGLPQANPVLLEPVGTLKVFIPDSYMGDVIGDLNKRRGRVMGMNPGEDGQQIVEAEVPMAEMTTYAIDLRSMTQGRGSFDFEFTRYEETPAPVQIKVIEEHKAQLAEDDE